MLEAIARNKVNLKRIETHRPDMLRVTESLIHESPKKSDGDVEKPCPAPSPG